jgi:hypothetical protein
VAGASTHRCDGPSEALPDTGAGWQTSGSVRRWGNLTSVEDRGQRIRARPGARRITSDSAKVAGTRSCSESDRRDHPFNSGRLDHFPRSPTVDGPDPDRCPAPRLRHLPALTCAHQPPPRRSGLPDHTGPGRVFRRLTRRIAPLPRRSSTVLRYPGTAHGAGQSVSRVSGCCQNDCAEYRRSHHASP